MKASRSSLGGDTPMPDSDPLTEKTYAVQYQGQQPPRTLWVATSYFIGEVS